MQKIKLVMTSDFQVKCLTSNNIKNFTFILVQVKYKNNTLLNLCNIYIFSIFGFLRIYVLD